MQIRRYPLSVNPGVQNVQMPVGSGIVDVGVVGGAPAMFAQVDENEVNQATRSFMVFEADAAIEYTPDQNHSVSYVGTVVIADVDYHINEVDPAVV